MFNQLAHFCLFFSVVECISHCQNVNVSQEIWKNEGVSIIYVMKNSKPNWQTHVTLLIQLQKSLTYIDVNANLIIATDKNCTAFKNVNDFKIDAGEIWGQLEHHSDYPEAYVVDRCGKVTYHIIFPWSLVKWFPFIKGAVLSTFFDKPCGPCDVFHSYQIDAPEHKFKQEDIKVYPKMSRNYDQQTNENGPPVEIIIKERHKHEGSNEVYEYTETELGNPKYHRHFHSLEDIEFMSYDNNVALPNINNQLTLDGSDREESIHDHFKHVSFETKVKRAGVSRREEQFFSSAELNQADFDKAINEIVSLCTDINDPEQSDSTYYDKLFHDLLKIVYSSDETFSPDEVEQREEISHHYEKLNNWLSYII